MGFFSFLVDKSSWKSVKKLLAMHGLSPKEISLDNPNGLTHSLSLGDKLTMGTRELPFTQLYMHFEEAYDLYDTVVIVEDTKTRKAPF